MGLFAVIKANVKGRHQDQGWETDPKFHFPIRGISTRPVALGTKRSRDGSLGGQVAVELNAVPVETVRAGC